MSKTGILCCKSGNPAFACIFDKREQEIQVHLLWLQHKLCKLIHLNVGLFRTLVGMLSRNY